MLPATPEEEHAYRLKLKESASKWELRTCPHCGKQGKGSPMTTHHFDNCKMHPDGPAKVQPLRKERVLSKEEREVRRQHGLARPEYKCPYCGKVGKESVGMRAWHGERCKWNTNIQDESYPKRGPEEQRYTGRDIDSNKRTRAVQI